MLLRTNVIHMVHACAKVDAGIPWLSAEVLAVGGAKSLTIGRAAASSTTGILQICPCMLLLWWGTLQAVSRCAHTYMYTYMHICIYVFLYLCTHMFACHHDKLGIGHESCQEERIG